MRLLAGRWRRRAVRHQAVGRNIAELAGLEVVERLDQLGLGVHHERAAVNHWLPDRLTAQDQHLQSGHARVPRRPGADRDAITGTQDHQLTLLYRVRDRTDRPAPGEYVNQCVVVTVPRDVQP